MPPATPIQKVFFSFMLILGLLFKKKKKEKKRRRKKVEIIMHFPKEPGESRGTLLRGARFWGTMLVLLQREENPDKSEVLRKPCLVTSVIFQDS